MLDETLLQAKSLSKNYGGNQAVNQVSFSLRRGAITGLIGPNGAGKTTLFSCVAGFEKASAGEVFLDQINLTSSTPSQIFAAGLARTFQIPRPFANMSVLENVMVAHKGQMGEQFWANWFQAAAVEQQERETRAAARHWLDFVGLSALEQQPAKVLSGGQRKLLELARAMVSQPKLVLLDEPGAGVNPALLDQIMSRVTELNKSGVSFFIIEHNMDLIGALCDSVMVMNQGQLLTSGSVSQVLSDPRVLEAYLGDEDSG